MSSLNTEGSETGRFVNPLNVSAPTIYSTFLRKFNLNWWELMKKYGNDHFLNYINEKVPFVMNTLFMKSSSAVSAQHPFRREFQMLGV